MRWVGEVEADVTGDYTFQTFSNSGIKMWIDDKLVINHWRQGWLPWKEVAKVRLEAGSAATSSGWSGARTRTWRRCSCSGSRQ